MGQRKGIHTLLIHILLFGILAVWMIPEVYMFTLSLRTPAQVFDPKLFTFPIKLDNFSLVIRDNPLELFFLNSLLISVATVFFVALFGSLFAYAVSILEIRGRKALYLMIIITLMVPVTSLVLPLAILLKNFGLSNTYAGIILPYTALGIPFCAIVVKGFLDDSPKDLFESSRIDGCSIFQTYFHIALPLIRPSLIFIVIWQFISAWNEFFLAFVILTEDRVKTLTIIPMQYSGFYMSNPGALFAILTLIALPLIIVYIMVQKLFIHGLTTGALKG